MRYGGKRTNRYRSATPSGLGCSCPANRHQPSAASLVRIRRYFAVLQRARRKLQPRR